MRYLVLDIETGGAASPDSTLLTAAFIVYYDNGVNYSLYLETKPDKNQPYIVTAEGMEVNGINIVEHDKKAITYKEAGTKLYNFLSEHCKVGDWRYQVLGFGIHSDLDKLFKTIITKNTFDQFCNYTRIDVAGLLKMLKISKNIAEDVPESVEELAKFLSIDHTPHNAYSDAKATFKIYQVLLSVFECHSDFEELKNAHNPEQME